MRRKDVAIAVGAGLLPVLVVLLASMLSIAALGPLFAVLESAIEFWFVGAALAVVSFLLRRRPDWRSISRGLGYVGVAWISFVAGFDLVLAVIFVLVGPGSY